MDNKTQEKLKELFDEYTKQLPNKIRQLQTHWQELCENFDSKLFRTFHREVHNLSGSAGTYGFMVLSAAARELENYLKLMLEEPNISTSQQTMISRLMNQIQSASLSSEERSLLSKKSHFVESKIVYVVDQDKYFVDELSSELSQVGYEMQRLNNFAELLSQLQKSPPIAIVIDTQFLGEAESKEFIEFQKQNDIAVPVFCTSSNNDMSTRLRAIRAGSHVFLQKPIDISYLMKTLEQACGFVSSEAFRILIIDDSLSLAEYYALILQEAGMITQTISNPLDVIEAITEFRPDLLLLDIYMPECSGIELAAALRQEPRYTHLPIIFLSNEGDKYKQLAALGLGGDDFLTKPVLPQHLVAAVKSRAKRAGVINSYMIRDSLTGLLNHTNILHQLDIEVIRAERHNQPLAFIMLDIDQFKAINDQHGHLMGDRVLKKLSELLSTRFRKTDSVGRYGGEEFAIILPNTTIADAQKVLDNLRQTFAQIKFKTEHTDFQVSFSGGIAHFPKQKSPSALIEAADQSLYKAKQNGRNQVVVS